MTSADPSRWQYAFQNQSSSVVPVNTDKASMEVAPGRVNKAKSVQQKPNKSSRANRVVARGTRVKRTL